MAVGDCPVPEIRDRCTNEDAAELHGSAVGCNEAEHADTDDAGTPVGKKSQELAEDAEFDEGNPEVVDDYADVERLGSC